MNILVYTSITNNHDYLKLQPVFKEDKDTDIQYMAYLDSDTTVLAVKSEAVLQWGIRTAVDKFKDPKRNCQIHKVLSHLYTFDFDYSIWIDGSVLLKASISKLIKDNIDNKVDIALLWHSERACIYKESWDCIHFNLDDPKVINEQMDFYKRISFPEHFGLSETPVIIRKNTRDVRAFNTLWWSILSRYSKRDQLSFDFVRWNLNMAINHIKGNIHNNDYFEISKHKVLREHEK